MSADMQRSREVRKAHTPGPWSLLPRNPLCIESPSGNIGLVNLARASEADARLIAAAPELLAALNAMLTDYRSEGCADPTCNICRRSKAAKDAANAAIAKADLHWREGT